MNTFDEHFSIDHLNGHVAALLNGHFDVIEERPRVSIGSDRIELNHFVRDQQKHLAAISRKVLSGRYTFSPFLEHEIPKADSSAMRTISIASIRDSIVQRALYHYSYEVVDARLTDAVFGYRRARSAHSAIRALVRHISSGRAFVFDADLSRFFDTVDHGLLLEKVDTLGLDGRAVIMIRRFLKTGRIPSAQVREHRERKGKQQKFAPQRRIVGVPQGGVLSGLLSNLYLAEFDRAVLDKFAGYIRYADDFVVCCESELECEQVRQVVEDQLKLLKVELNSNKTQTCVRADSGVEFLGFRVSTRGVRVRNKNVAKFKARIQDLLHRCSERLQEKPRLRESAGRTLQYICWRLAFKIRGPSAEQIQTLASRGQAIHPYRRSWIGFFRIVDDLSQIRSIDRWIRSQVSKFMWKHHRIRVRYRQMQDAGLPSLIKCLWKARRELPTVD